jgi:hypothetical protein
MELEFTEAGLSFMFRMVVSPNLLTPDQPYKAPDQPAAEDLMGLKRWLLDKDKKRAWIENEGTQGGVWKFANGLKVKMRKRYVDRLKELAKHYQGSGRLVMNVEGYEELCATLDGKKIVVESVEEDETPPAKA